MNDVAVMDISHRALGVAVALCAPTLGFGLVVGLIVSIFQAATQIHEATLAFIPKIVAVAVALIIFGPWMLAQIVGFTTQIFQSIPSLVR